MTALDQSHALITGGGSGVGAAIARTLADSGAKVTIAGRRLEPLLEIATHSDRIFTMVADVTHADSVAALFEKAVSHHGPVDIVVANAGAAQSKPFAKTSLEDWNAMLASNLTGTFLTLKQAANDMVDRGWGRLISVASTAGLKGYPYVAPYCAAKHGVIGLTRALALEYARTGVTVNALCPGFTETSMLEASIETLVKHTGRSEAEARKALASNNPMRRFIQPQEIADALLWLCGRSADSINGQAISISGGEI